MLVATKDRCEAAEFLKQPWRFIRVTETVNNTFFQLTPEQARELAHNLLRLADENQ